MSVLAEEVMFFKVNIGATHWVEILTRSCPTACTEQCDFFKSKNSTICSTIQSFLTTEAVDLGEVYVTERKIA